MNPITNLMQQSASTATVRPSPLSPYPLAYSSSLDEQSNPPSGMSRPRGYSDSSLLSFPASSSHPLNRVTASPSASPRSPSSQPGVSGDALKSSFRARSRSVGRIWDYSPARPTSIQGSSRSQAGASSCWWNKKELLSRPWDDKKTEEQLVPKEHNQAWESTRESVSQAAIAILGVAAIIAEGLVIGLEVAEASPIPFLQPVAKTLLNIWDAVQTVDMNRLAFLRLTQRCANILLSIRQEVEAAGEFVAQELSLPVTTLNKAFDQVKALMDKQSNSPFLKRYLKRDDTERQIIMCGDDLLNALRMFGLSIQVRTLKIIQAGEVQNQENTRLILSAIASSSKIKMDYECGRTGSATSPAIASSLSRLSLSKDGGSPSTVNQVSRFSIPPAAVLPTLRALQSSQNSRDAESDWKDLRQLMTAALQTGSDADMVSFLQVAREEMPDAIKSLQRALESNSDRYTKKAVPACEIPMSPSDDTLHQEFIESGIDSLRRMSDGTEASLPSWTITKFEVDAEQKIGIGFFSDVYKGTWKGRTVAIKVLADTTPHKLFVREMGIWKTLEHPNVLELYGASSASGDPPWFFVSPYERNGSLVEFLKRVSMQEDRAGLGLVGLGARFPCSRSHGSFGKEMGRVLKESDMYRFMEEIARGMEYLHSRGILHGDLKASNVLVDDDYRCVISDFGLSEMKSEAYRISGMPAPRGTLRWQAPELMGGLSPLTSAVDVYAYAISCVEITTMGQMPWALMDDDAVRYFVLKENNRPSIPDSFNSPELHSLLQACWHHVADVRPSFAKIVFDLQNIRQLIVDSYPDCSSSPRIREVPESEEYQATFSPDMCPLSPSRFPCSPIPTDDSSGSLVHVYSNARFSWDSSYSPLISSPRPPDYEDPSCTSSLYTDTVESHSAEDHQQLYEFPSSSGPSDEKGLEAKDERRYRFLLNHSFHPSLILPLWSPVFVQLGDVGYLSKPSGTFVTLFNAFKPHKSSHDFTRKMPSIAGYGHVSKGSHRQDSRNVARRSLAAFSGLLSFRSRTDIPVSRRHSYPLKAGHKTAFMCTETTEYQFVKKLDAPKAWFKGNVDTILSIYGAQHSIQKEDLFLVIGALQTPNYALFVSHNHPDGQVHFNVFSAPKKGQSWGTFTTDMKSNADRTGPEYDEPLGGEIQSASKVSRSGSHPSTVLVARLRFKPDVVEPTSL